MSKLEIFEPAMCCDTGLCGVSIDPELLRISTVVNTLKDNGVEVTRANLSSNPKAFIDNKQVNEYLNKFGADKLPVILIDDMVVKTGSYPSNEELAKWLDLDDSILDTEKKNSGSCCSGGNSSGCC